MKIATFLSVMLFVVSMVGCAANMNMARHTTQRGMRVRTLDGAKSYFIPSSEIRRYVVKGPNISSLEFSTALPKELAKVLANKNINYTGRFIKPGDSGKSGLVLMKTDGSRRFFIPAEALGIYEIEEPDAAGQGKPDLLPEDIRDKLTGQGLIFTAACNDLDC